MAEIAGGRLDLLRKRAGLSRNELARRVGVSQPTISRLITGETKNTAVLMELARELGTTPAYLTGESDDPEQLSGVKEQQRSFSHEPGKFPDLVELAEIDLRYGLGGTYLDSPVTPEKRIFSREWLRNFTRAAPEHLFWTIGIGDSMDPTIRSGEVILIDRSQDSPMMGDGIWAVAWGEVGMVKRLRPLPDGTIEMHSDNPQVRPATAADGELHVIGRVVAVVRKI